MDTIGRGRLIAVALILLNAIGYGRLIAVLLYNYFLAVITLLATIGWNGLIAVAFILLNARKNLLIASWGVKHLAAS